MVLWSGVTLSLTQSPYPFLFCWNFLDLHGSHLWDYVSPDQDLSYRLSQIWLIVSQLSFHSSEYILPLSKNLSVTCNSARKKSFHELTPSLKDMPVLCRLYTGSCNWYEFKIAVTSPYPEVFKEWRCSLSRLKDKKYYNAFYTGMKNVREQI